MGTRVFIPFGELLPDRKLFGNEGLLRAFGVTPVSGNYIQAPELEAVLSPSTEFPYGFHLHQAIESGSPKLYAYYGSTTALREIDVAAESDTDRTRAAGGAYAFGASPPLDTELWDFASYGENVIATNFEDEVQVQTARGSAFENMFTSTFKPQARFVFPIRQNLFLAYCFLPSTFDGVASGTHPQFVCWTQNDNIRVAGSEDVDSAHVGAGYQQFVGGDLGPITAAIGGDFGIVFHAGGITRIDGPPYEFRTIVQGDTTLFPYSVFRLDQDIYFWGSAGPSVLVGGEAPVRRLCRGKLQRSLLDNVTGFGSDFAVKAGLTVRDVSGGADPINALVRWAYIPVDDAGAGSTVSGTSYSLLIDHNIEEDRSTVSRAPRIPEEDANQVFFIRQAPTDAAVPWGPFGGLYCDVLMDGSLGTTHGVHRFTLTSADSVAPDLELRTAFGRLSDTHTTRIIAVRPVWSNAAGQASTVEGVTTIQVHTKNKPWEDETNSSEHDAFNEDGWIGTDSTVVGTYHSLTLKFTLHGEKIHEIEGLEVEYVEGPEYGA